MGRRSPLHLRVFLSSPGDVSEERRLATEILEQYQKKPHAQGNVTIQLIAWDDRHAPTPMVAGETPQESVNRFKERPANCDLTIVILWGRLGTKLPPGIVRADGSAYESGTVWEYEEARQAGKPVWVYRRTEKPRIDVDDLEFEAKRLQYKAIKDWFTHFKNPDGSLKGGINDYEKPQHFEDLLDKHLETFVRVQLESEETADHAAPAPSPSTANSTWSWPKPWDFIGYINDKRHNFIGRTWLFAEVETWRKSATQALLIVADYGVGKSAFMAELVCRNPQNAVVAHHFCHHDTAETLNPGTFVRSIAAQLAATLPDYKSAVEQDAEVREWLDKADTDPGSAIEQAIVAPLNRIATSPADTRYILVDGLDESLEFESGRGGGSNQHIARLLATRDTRLPAWLKIMATTRRRQEVLQRFQQSFRTQTLDAEDARNLEDIRDYVINRCRRAPLADKLAQTDTSSEEIVSILTNPERSRGKFLYVVRVLNDVASGSLDVTRLADLPPGMDGFYLDAFERRFRTVEYETVRPILALLAAAREPLGRSDLAVILERLESQVQTSLAAMEDFLSIRNKRYAFDHYSLAQWLTEENDNGFPRAGRFAVNLADAQERIRAWALQQIHENRAHESAYLARHLQAHLAPEDRANAYRTLLLDFRWLHVRLHEAGITPLLKDYGEAPEEPELSAVGQTLRRAAHIVGHEGVDWSGLDQLASQLSARLLHQEGPKIRRLLTEAHTSEHRQNTPKLRPLTASLQESSSLIRALEGHNSYVSTLALLPDGRLASGSGDHTIKLWDLASGHCTATLAGHSEWVNPLALLPGGRLASGAGSHTIKLWDLVSGHCTATLMGHSEWVNPLALLPGGRLASGAGDHTIKLWDLVSGRYTATLAGHNSYVSTLALLPDGRLASGSWDHTIKLWDLATGHCTATLAGHSHLVSALALLPDGRLASGSWDHTIKLWDLASGHCTATLAGHSRWVNALALLPDGRLASGSVDKTIRIWSWSSEYRRWTSSASFVADASITTLSYAPTQRILVAGDVIGRLHFLKWDDGMNHKGGA
jgi:hypothetical protein